MKLVDDEILLKTRYDAIVQAYNEKKILENEFPQMILDLFSEFNNKTVRLCFPDIFDYDTKDDL